MERDNGGLRVAQPLNKYNLDTSAVQRLKEHQKYLRRFVQEWSVQQDHILRAIVPSFQDSICSEVTIETKFQPTTDTSFEEAVCQEIPVDSELPDKEQILPRAASLPNKEHIYRKAASWPSRPILRRSASTCSDVLSAMRAPNSSALRNCGVEKSSSTDFVHDFVSTLKEQPKANLRDVVASQWFEGICSVCIIVNAAFIAYSADYAAKNLDSPTNNLVVALEIGFTAWYTLELCLRMVAYKLGFFFEADWMWNIFDTILVLNAIYDQIAELTTAQQGAGGSVVFLRVVRLMKMLKLLRMVRIMRMFKELRLIVTSIKGSVKSMFWAILLILIITYIVGICFLQAGTTYLQEHRKNLSEQEVATINNYWGRLSVAMLSLYMASTNGAGWQDMANSLIPVGYPFYILFLLYIAFFMFVIMNTLTSLFIEATISNAEKDKVTVIRTELQKRSAYMQRAEELFKRMDHDGSGDISEEEFSKRANDPEMLAFCSSLELDVSDIAQFYRVLSCGGKFAIDMDTFVVSCMKLKGFARSLDLMGLIASEARSSRMVDEVLERCSRIQSLLEKNDPHCNGLLEPSGDAKHQTAGNIFTI